ncbi:MAG: ABC-three component system middle component 6 [Candidatus Aenigmatarchaeota archaeon]
MILPTKHIKLSNSLLSVGATLLRHIEADQTVTSLWNETHLLPEIKTFERFTLGLDFLFMLGIIDFKDGLLARLKK